MTRAAGERRWHATEPDIAGIEDAQDLADLMRENDPDVALLFFEQDDEWLTIVRLDADGVLRTFVSDVRAVYANRLVALVFEESQGDQPIGAGAGEGEGSEEEESSRPEVEFAGAHELLADLGMPGRELVDLCNAEGTLPADVIFAVCERLGCADEIEAYR